MLKIIRSIRFEHDSAEGLENVSGQPCSRSFKKSCVTISYLSLLMGFVFLVPELGLAQTSLPTLAPAVPAATQGLLDPLNELVNQAIETTSHRFLDADVHTPWQIIHGLLALRQDYVIKSNGRPVNAIDWISHGATFRSAPWFEATKDGGRAHPYNGTPYEFEGHVNQFLAVIAMSNLPLDHKFEASGGQIVTMQQMVDHAQKNVSSREEITWTLWFLSQYVDQDEEWMNNDNEPWSMERLVRMQVKASPYDAPCGGTHGMFALAYARNSYAKKHGELRGAWLEADQKLQRYLGASQRMQNRDGSFATNWFKSTGYSENFNERIQYSGHMLEWILVSIPKSRYQEQWIMTGVQTLCYDLIRNAHEPSECGPLYHALHALVLYRQQMSSDSPILTQPSVARVEQSTPGGPIMQGDILSNEVTPKTDLSAPLNVAPPVRMATQPQPDPVNIDLNRRQKRLRDRRNSALDENFDATGSFENTAEIGTGSKSIPVLMPILIQVAMEEVASSGEEAADTLPPATEETAKEVHR